MKTQEQPETDMSAELESENGTPEPAKKKNRVLQVIFFLVKLAIAAVLIRWIVLRDAGRYSTVIFNVSLPAMTAAVLCIAAQTTLSAYRWKLLLNAQGIFLKPVEILSLTLQGCFFTFFVPGGAVGGDVVKAAFTVKRAPEGKKFDGVFSILIDRIIGMAGLFAITILAAAVFYKQLMTLSIEAKTGILLLLGLSVFGLAAAATVFFHEYIFKWSLARKCLHIGDRFTKGAMTRTLKAAHVYRSKWKILLGTLSLSIFITHPLCILALFFIIIGTEKHAPEIGTCLLASTLSNTASAIPLTPGGLGTRDVVTNIILVNGGISDGSAAAAPLLYTLALILVALTGGIAFILDGIFLSSRLCKTRTNIE